MISNFLKYLSTQKNVRRFVETNSIARNATRRYIAGETLEEELAACAQLEQQGLFSALDHLGENVTTLAEADNAVAAYLEALDQIDARKLPATISLKLTQFGLDLSEAACVENIRKLAARAKAAGTRVEIDMEGSIYTQKTVDIATRVADEFGNLRLVLQAYLYRTEADVAHVNRHAIPVRLCKGAYAEPASIAYPKKSDVDQNYIKLMRQLLDHGSYPAIATHDDRMVDATIEHVTTHGFSKNHFEFQMLYGIRRDLQKRVHDAGYRLRLYVPYGTAWYPYFMRRLAERPANLLFLLKSAGR